ncbi:MAG: 5-formyltetrahydrofolate cyclo-ligase [Candidatus Omnitrophica bacterium]|nr:5-formyltetrahydrofolate cyclo-ligase [Candidatus Omnitrophota bacterium]MCM8791434.1 5-formyltetrahydrofolate cyclo-ligase [Candidatus Omnitrophota bacterium]
MKHKIRIHIKEKHKSYSLLEKAAKSDIIKNKLFNEEEFKKAKVVMFYVSLKDEVNTISMIDETIKMGKKVCVPVILKEDKRLVAGEIKDREKDLERQHFGIYQPKAGHVREVPLDDIDLVVVPGVAFDRNNVRLGRGHGYYDRFLCGLPEKTKTIGLAFDFQVVEHLPKDSHDIPVSKIITA